MRLYQEASGIDYVQVNGDEIAEHGQLTGRRPGTALRWGRDTDTVDPASLASSDQSSS